MDVTQELLEIVKLILPAVVVFIAVRHILNSFLNKETNRAMLEFRKNNSNKINPTRMQAYERLILYLERIDLDKLVVRLYRNGMSGKLLHRELLKTIREEYDHNIAQQLYVSTTAWDRFKFAMEETVKLINIASTKVDNTASGLDFSKAIADLLAQINETPTKNSIDFIKREFRKTFY